MRTDLTLIAPPVLVAAALVSLLLRSWPAARRASLRRFARRVDLPVPAEHRDASERLLAGRNLATDLGAIVGVAAVVAWAALVEPEGSGTLWPLVVVGAAFVGAAVAAGATAAVQAGRAPGEDGPRIARATAPALEDYLAPMELTGGRVVALLPLAGLLMAVSIGAGWRELDAGRVLSSGLLAAVALSLVALVASEVAGRRLIERPQMAGTDLELAWSDAVRARVLRDIVTVPIAIGTYATFGVLLATAEAIGDPQLRNAAHGIIGLIALAVVVFAAVSTLSRPQRHFRRRLWPRLGAGALARSAGAP